ncbi:hypothetical protein ACQPW3_34915 [Actinosynnema sp. CA-248983]
MTKQPQINDHNHETLRDYDQLIATATDRVTMAEKATTNSRIALNALVAYREQHLRDWVGELEGELAKQLEARQ